jgi:ABC-type protease/lipase transport system fused ATPase/permease subunit
VQLYVSGCHKLNKSVDAFYDTSYLYIYILYIWATEVNVYILHLFCSNILFIIQLNGG